MNRVRRFGLALGLALTWCALSGDEVQAQHPLEGTWVNTQRESPQAGVTKLKIAAKEGRWHVTLWTRAGGKEVEHWTATLHLLGDSPNPGEMKFAVASGSFSSEETGPPFATYYLTLRKDQGELVSEWYQVFHGERTGQDSPAQNFRLQDRLQRAP